MGQSQPTVLLVEDNELVRDTIIRMLALHGYGAIAAGTAEQGLVEFESNPAVALAILDMMLPGKSGLDLAAELERRRPGFRILYMSGLTESIAMDCIARRAPEQVLFKPFGEDALIQRVTALLESASARPGPGRSMTVTAIPPSAFPWDRLVEGSDQLGVAGTKLMSYRDTTAGYAIAITHVAVLRAAEVPYAFRFTGNAALPLALTVLPGDCAHAMTLIERVGLGADIAPAA